MKLPFNSIVTPLLKPYMRETRLFCSHPVFSICIPYTYFYGTLGFFISAHHLRIHFGETPSELVTSESPNKQNCEANCNCMLLHDLKIIATSMGLVQYACVIVGCYTKNPALFLPHLVGQLLVALAKILNLLLLLVPINFRYINSIPYKAPAIMLMTFNWFQEFCVFRQYLCICDL